MATSLLRSGTGMPTRRFSPPKDFRRLQGQPTGFPQDLEDGAGAFILDFISFNSLRPRPAQVSLGSRGSGTWEPPAPSCHPWRIWWPFRVPPKPASFDSSVSSSRRRSLKCFRVIRLTVRGPGWHYDRRVRCSHGEAPMRTTIALAIAVVIVAIGFGVRTSTSLDRSTIERRQRPCRRMRCISIIKA